MNVSPSWQPGLYRNGAEQLPYQLFVPESTVPEKRPLILFLHGTGEAGTDNRRQLFTGSGIGPDYFINPARQEKEPCFVLAPQTPEAVRWASVDLHEYDLDHTPMTSSMKLLLELIDSLVASLPIDPSRIYIGGMSRGGQGAWNACFHRPSLFAAAYASCCSASPAHAHLLKNIPLWIFHGDADETTSVEYSRHMIAALRPQVTDPRRLKYTEIPGGDHGSAWQLAHQGDDLHEWLFSWKKNLSSAA